MWAPLTSYRWAVATAILATCFVWLLGQFTGGSNLDVDLETGVILLVLLCLMVTVLRVVRKSGSGGRVGR